MNSFEKSNLQQTDMQSLQSRILSLKKLSSLYTDNQEYTDLLKLYKKYLSYKDTSSPFLSVFAKKIRKVNRATQSQLVQESPIITLGTMIRILSIDQSLEEKMLKYGPENIQILSFGAGSDLRFQQDKYLRCSNIIELDFKESIDYKQKSLPAKNNIKYVACDLINIDEVISSLTPLLQKNMHTIVLMECLLCYLPINIADAYFDFFNKVVTENKSELLHYVIYDPVALSKNDSFTNIMCDNLQKFNNLQMYSLKNIDTIDDYLARFKNKDLKFDCKNLWDYAAARDDKQKLFKLCLVDEFEELKLLLSHYIILNS